MAQRKEGSYVHSLGVTPQRNKKKKLHTEFLFIIIRSCWFGLMIAGLGFAPLSAGDVE